MMWSFVIDWTSARFAIHHVRAIIHSCHSSRHKRKMTFYATVAAAVIVVTFRVNAIVI